MCGICVVWGPTIQKETFAKSLESLTPRGPDVTQSEFLSYDSSIEIAIGFTRLHIQGSSVPEQPFRVSDTMRVMCNGEIFNSDFLVRQLKLKLPAGHSDCAVIPPLIGMGMTELCRQLDGDFAIVAVDLETGCIRVARDPYGVRPLFYGAGPGWQSIASEIKAFPRDATCIEAIEPGSWKTFAFSGDTYAGRWHEIPWLKTPYWHKNMEGLCCGENAIRNALEEAVEKRLTTVREIGACLSGGLDSSLVAAIAAHFLKHTGKKLHTYSIGMDGSPDLECARKVAKHIGSIHHERIVTAEECLAAIPEVIRAIESFDVTSVRASVGNYLVGRMVREETPMVKVVLNGDGADEILGGYLYMRAAPNNAAFEAETTRLLTEIHRFDVLRSERSMSAHGLESRSPFLDRQFVSVARSVPTDALRSSAQILEKSYLRSAFDNTGILPPEILWRAKEAFSDGISRAEKSWFQMARAEGERLAGDWVTKAQKYIVNRPKTAEAYWYREIFHSHYPLVAAETMPTMWMPRFIEADDPSARTLSMYDVKT